MLAATALATLPGAGSQAWAARCDNQANPVTITEMQQMNYGTIAEGHA